jgi:LRP1 type putative zinc finger protein
MTTHRLTLKELRYSQNSIARRFSSGSDVHGPPLSQQHGKPAMDVVQYEGRWHTLNNRTLFNLNCHFTEHHEVTVRIVPLDCKFFDRYTTQDRGCSVIVREKSRRRSRRAQQSQTTECLDCSNPAARDCDKDRCATCCWQSGGSCDRHGVSAHDGECKECYNTAALDCEHGCCGRCCPGSCERHYDNM